MGIENIPMRIMVLSLLTWGIPGAILPARAEGDNLLNNPGFEDGQAGWIFNNGASTGETKIDAVTGAEGKEVRSGEKALRIRNPSGTTHLYQAKVGYSDQSYKFSFWARSDGKPESKLSVCLYLYGKSNSYLGSQNIPLLRADGSPSSPDDLKVEWRGFRAKIKVDTDQTPAADHFALAFIISGDVVLDEVVLLPAD